MYFATNTNGVVGTFMIMLSLVMIAGTVTILLYVLSLQHVIKHKDVPRRKRWLLVSLVPLIGSALYFIAILVPYNRAHPYIKPKN
jgi:hypothetical protein